MRPERPYLAELRVRFKYLEHLHYRGFEQAVQCLLFFFFWIALQDGFVVAQEVHSPMTESRVAEYKRELGVIDDDYSVYMACEDKS
jgi:hypothetical protein